MVDWRFLFKAMATLGILEGFINMTNLLCRKAGACVKVNGIRSEEFQLERKVQQGCPLIPYMFLIIAKILNTMVSRGLAKTGSKGLSCQMGVYSRSSLNLLMTLLLPYLE